MTLEADEGSGGWVPLHSYPTNQGPNRASHQLSLHKEGMSWHPAWGWQRPKKLPTHITGHHRPPSGREGISHQELHSRVTSYLVRYNKRGESTPQAMGHCLKYKLQSAHRWQGTVALIEGEVLAYCMVQDPSQPNQTPSTSGFVLPGSKQPSACSTRGTQCRLLTAHVLSGLLPRLHP